MGSDELRVAVGHVEREIDRLVNDPDALVQRSRAETLASSWRRLVELLALGSAPELVACPRCGQTGMRAATICGFCWGRITPRSSA